MDQRTLDDQKRLVAEAILLVARGGSPRVTITGLDDGERILDASRALAAASGVRLIAVPSARADQADVRVVPLELPAEADNRLRGIAASFRAFRTIRPIWAASTSSRPGASRPDSRAP